MAAQNSHFTSQRNLPAAWILVVWAIGLVAILLRLLILPPGSRTLFPVYHDAAQHWLSGVDLYPRQIESVGFPLFRYSPTVAVVLMPLAPLPEKLGDIGWRLINAAALLVGLLALARTLAPQPPSRGRLTALLLLMAPLALLGDLSNGQCNALVIGLTLVAFAGVARQRWTLAAVCMAVATLFKLHPIAAGLLLSVIQPRRFGLRYLGALTAGLLLPFLCQHTDYVLRQYGLWFHYVAHEDRSTWTVYDAPVDLALLFRVWVMPISLEAYRVIEVLAGLGFGGVVLASARTGRPAWLSLFLALGLACVWMTALGPSSEAPTYLILAPAVTWGLLLAWTEPTCRFTGVVRILMTASYTLLLSPRLMGWMGAVYSEYRVRGPQPAAGLIFLAGLLIWAWSYRPGVHNSSASSLLKRLAPLLTSLALPGNKE
jgi:hypothetical protein